MSEREKLIELIEWYFSGCNTSSLKLADHLLANGVRLETKQATSDKASTWISVEDIPFGGTAPDAVDIEKTLAWLEDYSILDRHEVYTNGVLLVPLFRVEQALVDKAYNGLLEG